MALHENIFEFEIIAKIATNTLKYQPCPQLNNYLVILLEICQLIKKQNTVQSNSLKHIASQMA